MSRREVARLGGLARQALHGDVGTPGGRRKGGANSLVSHARLKTKFRRLKPIRTPSPSRLLAEYLGMVAGDGHIDTYQVTLTTNSETDLQHAKHFAKTASHLFGVQARISFKTSSKACVVTLNSKTLSDYLQVQGFPKGSKIKLGLPVPRWISNDKAFSFAFIRGLFDSDGCVYQDKHLIRGKKYLHIGLAFANNEEHLLEFFKATLVRAGLRPTQKTKYRIFLRRSADIDKYFLFVGTSNRKHMIRYQKFRRVIRRGA